MNIDTMEAGREMDALVAERLFGHDVTWLDHRNESGVQPHIDIRFLDAVPYGGACAVAWDANDTEVLYQGEWVPDYSTDIAAAWQVVEKMHESGRHLVLVYEDLWQRWMAKFPYRLTGIEETYGSTESLAICRAALKATTQETP